VIVALFVVPCSTVATAVTRPDESTVATAASLVDHVTLLFAVLEGDTTAASCSLCWLTIEVEGFSPTPFTGPVKYFDAEPNEPEQPIEAAASKIRTGTKSFFIFTFIFMYPVSG